MSAKQIIAEVSSKYGEWLEMAGDNAPALLNEILANIIIIERSKNEYYEKTLKYYDKGVRNDSTYTTNT